MDDHTYHQEPKEIDFQEWLYGITKNIHAQYIEALMTMDADDLIETQEQIKKWEEWKNG
jgi:hypothetical protein